MISVRLQSFLIVALFSESVAQLSFVTPPHIGATVSFSENQPVGTALYTIQANDPAGNPPIYTVLNSTCESSQVTPVFNISSTDQLVVPAEGLDAEECSKYTFTFRVSAGTSTLDSGPLTILVTDINDNAPTFNKSSYSGEVWKTDKKGQIVNNDAIIATDPDVSKLPVILSISGAQTTFAIYQNGSVYVNDMSGLASLASPTVLTIQASDGGLTSTALLTIIVHEDPCSSSLCQNGGSCTSTRFNHSCSCLFGYTGDNCQNVNYCLVNPCNLGTCINQASSYACDCTGTGFCGMNCTEQCPITSTDKPQSCQCEHGGSCLSLGIGHVCVYAPDPSSATCTFHYQPQSCQCEHGGSCLSLGIGHVCVYAPDPTSATCTFHYDPCKAAPCQNNGTCSQNNGTYSCSCLGSYVGKHCESVNYCDHDNCRHGSTCINLPHSYLCSCRPGNVGEHCTDVDYCHQTHCQHGGTCVNLPNGYMCNYLSTTHEANTTFHLSPVG